MTDHADDVPALLDPMERAAGEGVEEQTERRPLPAAAAPSQDLPDARDRGPAGADFDRPSRDDVRGDAMQESPGAHVRHGRARTDRRLSPDTVPVTQSPARLESTISVRDAPIRLAGGSAFGRDAAAAIATGTLHVPAAPGGVRAASNS